MICCREVKTKTFCEDWVLRYLAYPMVGLSIKEEACFLFVNKKSKFSIKPEQPLSHWLWKDRHKSEISVRAFVFVDLCGSKVFWAGHSPAIQFPNTLRGCYALVIAPCVASLLLQPQFCGCSNSKLLVNLGVSFNNRRNCPTFHALPSTTTDWCRSFSERIISPL